MRSLAAAVLFMISAGAQAHPGHGIAELWHLLTEPDHLALLLLALALLKWGQTSFKRQRERRVRSPFHE